MIVLNIIACVFLLLGGAFALIAALGLWRFQDVFGRLHCTTKAGTLGSVFVVIALGVYSGVGEVWLRCIVLLTFLVLTGPVAAHAIARAAWSKGPVTYPSQKPNPNKGENGEELASHNV